MSSPVNQLMENEYTFSKIEKKSYIDLDEESRNRLKRTAQDDVLCKDMIKLYVTISIFNVRKKKLT
jgi:hypothetical protein